MLRPNKEEMKFLGLTNPLKSMSQKRLCEITGITKEEAKLIKRVIKTYPTILDSDGEGFCIESRTLWKELGKPQAEYQKWIKRKVIDIGFIENTDFEQIDSLVDMHNNSKRKLVDYLLTIDCAKQVAMMQKGQVGMDIRTYFIKMEKMIKYIIRYELTRNEEKYTYKLMCRDIDLYCQRNYNTRAKGEYMEIADGMNEILFGYNAKTIRNLIGNDTKITRDFLTEEENKYLLECQKIMRVYLLDDDDDMNIDTMLMKLKKVVDMQNGNYVKELFYNNHKK